MAFSRSGSARSHWFLSPSVDGVRVADRYWVACLDHVQDITASAAAEGLDVHVIPMDSLMGQSIGPVDPVAGPAADDSEDDSEPLVWTFPCGAR